MKKIILAFVLICAGFSAAQSNIYAGGSLGVSAYSIGQYQGRATFPITAHIGFKEVFSRDAEVRVDLRFLLGGGTGFEVGANSLYNFSVVPDLPLVVYAGGGIKILIASELFLPGVGVITGVDYYLSEQVSLFGEGRFDSFFPGFLTQFGIGVGAKFHF